MRSYLIALTFIVACHQILMLNAFSLFKNEAQPAADPTDYGVDISFPIHHYLDKDKAPVGYKRYEELMNGCYAKFSKRECDATERARLDMNKRQPASQHNYTEIGFKKLKAPKAAWDPLIAFYQMYKDDFKPENWPRGNTYVNNWEVPTHMISLEDRALRGGLNVKDKVWSGLKPILEEWTGKKLEPTSLYGIRVYHEKAILSTRKSIFLVTHFLNI
jgi:prolyl 4-hydroxylase